jgi:electron transfer flavoprotein beta subunit
MVNIIVCMKDIVDVAEIKTDPDTNTLLLEGIPFKISDFDKNALEAAIQIKEKLGGNIITITVGRAEAQERIREALAMGADEARLLVDPMFENLDTHGLSVAIATAIKKIGAYDLILCGEASADVFSAQIGPRVAELLDIPQITYARSITATADGVKVERDVGDVNLEVEASYPVLITVLKEINEPRLPTLIQILGASSKKIETWNAESLGIQRDTLGLDVNGFVKTEQVRGITIARKNIMIEGEVDEVVEKLTGELEKHGIIK